MVTFPMLYAVKSSFFLIFTTLTLGLKPVLDFFWNYKIPLGNFSLSFQGIIGLIWIAFAISLSVISIRNRTHQLYLIFFSLCTTNLVRHTGTSDFTLKYCSSISGLVIIPLLFEVLRSQHRYMKQLRWFTNVSLSLIGASLLLQLSGVIPWHTFDDLVIGIDPINCATTLKKTGRLTGFYYHPLDLLRTTIWFFLGLAERSFLAPTNITYFAIAAFSFFATRTVHRTSLILCVLLVVLLSIRHKNFGRGSKIIVIFLLSFAASLSFFSFTSGYNYWSLFGRSKFIFANAQECKGLSDLIQETIRSTPEKNTEWKVGRSRSHYWKTHARWIKDTFTPMEWLIGTSHDFPKNEEPEPHNQLIDSLERFGILGTVLIIAMILITFRQIPAPTYWKGAILFILGFYGMITEVLVMPTFMWWALLFAFYGDPNLEKSATSKSR